MAELILPGVYIDVRAEALIVGGPISVGNIGIVGTAAAGTLTARLPGHLGNGAKVKVEAVPPIAPEPAKSKVTLTFNTRTEVFTAKDGTELVSLINAGSAIATAAEGNKPAELPSALGETAFTPGASGQDATETDYKRALDKLLNEDAHIIVAAGLEEAKIGDELKTHVEAASTDKVKRDRIAVAGSAKDPTSATKSVQSSDRLIFVTPGIKVNDAAKAADPAVTDASVVLPGAYTAAAVAGMLSARDPHISLTNKTLSVGGLEKKFTSAELELLVKAQVLAIEERNGFRVVKAITTDNGAFRQITTRRIVDFAKYGVRSAAEPFIGLLNNDRVRKALKGSINGFLAGMVDDEMLVSYELDVTATRDEEIRGIAKVTMTVRPTFSIDYIKVVMFLG